MTNVVLFPSGENIEITVREPPNHIVSCVKRLAQRVRFIKNILIVIEDNDGRYGIDGSVSEKEKRLALANWLNDQIEQDFYDEVEISGQDFTLFEDEKNDE